jgi:hypothetical protein
MNMATKRLTATISISVLTMAALLTPGSISEASAADPFGPIESRSFHLKPGVALEKPGADCSNNTDVLLITGPNVASAKKIDVSPRTYTFENKNYVPTNACVAPNCKQVYVSVDSKDAVGTRTLTLKHADGRTLTTTFEVPENAGRCDVPKKGK